jgi:N-acetylglucosamine-6-sulfatase
MARRIALGAHAGDSRKRAQASRWSLFASIVVLLGSFVWMANGSIAPISASTIVAPGRIAVGDTVTGAVAGVGTVDTYPLFVSTPGATVLLHVSDDSCDCRWSLAGPAGTEFDQDLVDAGPRWLAPGEYTLTVSGASAGTYGFDVLAVPVPQSFTTALGATVSAGAPAAGAGSIETAGAQDVYSFTVPSGGASVILRVLSNSCNCDWSLRAAGGPPIFDRSPMTATRVGLSAGTYALRVSGRGAAVGTYAFASSAAPAAQDFTIAIGDSVSPGTPGPGAGNLETPGSMDVYSFDAPGGTRVGISGSSCASNPSFALVAPDGRFLARDAVCGGSVVIDLPADDGRYALRVSAGITNTGAYALQIGESSDPPTVTPSDADVFTVAPGQTISDGAPGAGAGNIEVPGALDAYAFEGIAGQTIVVDDLTTGNCSGLEWSASLPDGAPLVGEQELGCPGSRSLLLPQTGRYAIDVRGSGDATGTYSFALRAAPPQQVFAIAVGAAVRNGVPSAGAGNLNLPGSVDVYRFAANRGQSVVLSDTTAGGCVPIDAVLSAPDGDAAGPLQLGCAGSVRIAVQSSGTHVVFVAGRGAATGTYSFKIIAAPNAPTPKAVAKGEGAVKLTWTNPAFTGGAPITDAQVSVFNATGGRPTGVAGALSRMVGSSATTYTFTGLTQGVSYSFVIRMTNVAGLGVPSARSAAIAPANNTRPNILFILTDDQRYDSLAQVPALNAMPNWFRFTNSFVNEPLCCPSRATFLSGQYSHHTGVQKLFDIFDDRTSSATMLHAAGYRTGFLGKYMFGYPTKTGPVPRGWDNFEAYRGPSNYYQYDVLRNGTLVHYGSSPADYSTDVWTNRASDFIRRADPAQPFFLEVAYNAPHTNIVPAPRHVNSCASQAFPVPQSFNWHDPLSQPLWLAAMPPQDVSLNHFWRQRTCETLKAVDEGVVSLLDLLRSIGRLSNTYVVFTSDNGFAFGEHSLIGKGDLFEESIRVPLMVRGPGIVAGTTGRLTSNIDLVPSLLALAKTTPPPNFVDGVSWAANARHSAVGATNPPDVLLRGCRGIDRCGEDSPPGMGMNWGLRTARYKYIEYPFPDAPYSVPYVQLFDLDHDPYEQRNLGRDPALAATRANLQQRLVARRGF